MDKEYYFKYISEARQERRTPWFDDSYVHVECGCTYHRGHLVEYCGPHYDASLAHGDVKCAGCGEIWHWHEGGRDFCPNCGLLDWDLIDTDDVE